jgi:hypothetical protein
MAVEVATDPTFKAGIPRPLFETRFSPLATRPFDVTPDGKRFLVVKSIDQQQAPAQINVVQNWFEELKSLVPTRNK